MPLKKVQKRIKKVVDKQHRIEYTNSCAVTREITQTTQIRGVAQLG